MIFFGVILRQFNMEDEKMNDKMVTFVTGMTLDNAGKLCQDIVGTGNNTHHILCFGAAQTTNSGKLDKVNDSEYYQARRPRRAV